MKILNIYRKELKKNQLPKIFMSKSELKENLKLITEKRSTLSARERKAVLCACEEKGIKI